MNSPVTILLTTALQLLLLPPPSHSLPGLVITIKADEKQHGQYQFTLLTDRQEVRLDEVSAHPPLTTYTPPASTSYRPPQPPTYQPPDPPTYQPPDPPTFRPAYQSSTNSITRYKKHGPTRYKPPARYKPSKGFPRNKKWKSRRRGPGPPRKRNLFPKFFKLLKNY